MTADASTPSPVASSLGAPTLIPRLVALVIFMQLLDGTIITTSLPVMARDFGVDAVSMSVGVTAYMLALAVVLPAAGWLGDRYGARRILIGSVSLFTVASLLCAIAPSLPLFVAARLGQGAAAGLMAPVGRLLVLRHAPRERLIDAISTITWPALFAPVVGPALGAWITETVGWQWNFLVNLPLGLTAVALFLARVTDDRGERQVPFDTRGFLLSSGALLLLLGGIDLAVNGSERGAGAGAGLVAVVLGAGLALLAILHLRRSPAPLVDLGVVAEPTYRLASVTAGTAARVMLNATPFLLPLMFQVGMGMGVIRSGRLLLAYFLGNLAMKSITTPILRRWGFRRVTVASGLVAALGVAALALVPASLPEAALWGLLIVAGASRSLQLTAMNTLSFADVDPALRATATTLNSITVQIASVLGVASSVVLARLSQGVRGGDASALVDFRIALLAEATLGALAALAFLRLATGAGREIMGPIRDGPVR